MKRDFSKGIVIFAFANIIIFTYIVLYIFWKTGNEPATLISYFYKGMIGELSVLGIIKAVKVFSGGKKNSSEEGNHGT